VADLAVITGTTHGIGRVTARELARAGYAVVMLCRDLPAAQAVREDILQRVAGASIQAIQCDLASLASVRAAAALVCERFGGIRLFINNAGITTLQHQLSADGFELTFDTNHLGPFLLTELLRDRMTAPGRIINVASRVHLHGGLDLARVRSVTGRFNPLAAYAQSKLANVLHAFALARRLADVVVQDIEATVFLRGELGHCLGSIGLGDVAREYRGLAAFVLDLLGEFLGTLGAAIDQHDSGAFAREQDGGRHAVAHALATRRSTCDHRNFALQSSGHVFSPDGMLSLEPTLAGRLAPWPARRRATRAAAPAATCATA